ncbi:MAG: diguanylate cyclase, partial [Gammaproteobacteria bacterium]|nr:diguanylate cyclase [Gammaproteobacteria bacterium]
MPKLQSSMRASLGLTVLIMGLLGMMLAVATGEAYQRLALDNQRKSFVSLAKLKIQEITENLAQDSVELGLNAQATPGFHQAVISKDSIRLSLQLDEHFHRAFVTLGRVKLIKMYVYDKEFRLISSSEKGNPTLSDNKPVCTGLLSTIASRSKTARLKPDSELCRTGMRPVLATIVPVGGLQIKGYLQLIIDPTPNFAKADSGLGTPLKLTGPDKTIHYQSANWPRKLSKNILLAEYRLFTPQNQPLFDLTFASNIAELRKQLSTTRNFIFSIAAIIMLGTTLIALLMLQHTALNPLSTLTNHLRRVQKDKSQLGTKVIISGNSEIVELATDFNNMSSELSTLYRTLENMAFTDALTGMPNRVLFYNRLEQITMTTARYKTPFALMMMDLNRFKNINDTLGHHIGDRLLKTVGERLQTILRESDTVARLGGDEFAALLPAIDHDEGVTIVAEKIVNALNKPIAVEGHNLSIGISIGLVRCPRDGDKATLLMQHADLAMYHAKRKGLGYVFYDESMSSENLFELTMESELRQAVENRNFELYFQPKIDPQPGHIT